MFNEPLKYSPRYKYMDSIEKELLNLTKVIDDINRDIRKALEIKGFKDERRKDS